MTTDKDAPKQWKERILIGWKAWYKDGSSYSSKEYKWRSIPQRHFLGVKRFYKLPDGSIESEMFVGQDLYILCDEYRDKMKWIPKSIKIGEWMKDEDFHPIYDKAKDEEEVIEEMI